MGVLIALAGLALFVAGAFAGVIGTVSLAIRREERNLTLTGEAPDIITRAGRHLNGARVRAPRPVADRETAPV